MQRIFLLCGWLCLSGMVGAQTLTVLDADSEEPVIFATIFSARPHVSAETNFDGQADISAFKGAQKIEIGMLGYAPFHQSYAELETAGFVVRLEPMAIGLNVLVVSGTRWEQTSGTVVSKIVSIRPEDVALQNPQTAADLLGLSGKVFIQKSQQGGGSPMIRGFATNRLIYTVDGVRMNTAIFRGGNIQNVINLDPFATEHTEVLFGPGSVIYGSDAIGGVMSFKTLEPVLNTEKGTSVHGKAVMRYATANNERTGHLDINLGWKKWAALTSFSNWNYDHLRQGTRGPDDYLKPYFVQRQDSADVVISQEDPLLQLPSAYTQTNLMQKLRFRPNIHWNFIYGFHFSETSPYGRYDRHNRMRNDLPRYAEWNYGPQKWLMHNLETTHLSGNALYDRMSLRLAVQAFEESRIDRSLNNPERNTQRERVDAYSANFDLLRQIGERHTLYYGLEYVLNEVQSFGEVLDITTGKASVGAARYPQSTWASLGLYLNHEFRWTEQFTLQTGIRYNRFQLEADFANNLDFYPFPFTVAELNNGALTGSVGAVFRPNAQWLIRANAGTALRAPNVDDIGKIFDSEPGTILIPNPDLDAEYAYNADLGIAHHFGKAVRLELNGYYTLLQNALVRRPFALNGQDSILYDGQLSQVQAIQNAAEARVFGLQVGLNIDLGKYFNFSTDLNFQDGEEELDDGTTSPSRHAAPFFGVTRLTYEAKLFTLQVYALFQGERSFEELAVDERGKDEIYAKDTAGNNYAPAWYTINVKAGCPITKGIRINVGLENLTDQRYRPYSSGISGAGRNFVLSVQGTF